MSNQSLSFQELALSESILKSLDDVGYERPSPIQARIIPFILEGRDVLGQAQTGTGKTAAFALPLLSRLNAESKDTQVMVLTPTRELAIQVAEAFHKYAAYIKGFHVLPIYGGQDYGSQIRALKRGVHVVVGTPGRVMDHMRKGTLKLDNLKTLVLDEADEMLRMGFIDDVEWVMEQTPATRQIALFSATMPQQIRRIAEKYLNNPEQITIEVKTATAETIRQRYWPVSGVHKLDALTRILEAETFDAMIVFVRTKTATLELAEKLEARGFASAALNGDIAQAQRERTVQALKDGKLDILVATDVAARGLDVNRISHVVNFDIPYDTEAYIHRIGRTGRAGREGDAILFVAPREKRMLHAIEKATRKQIDLMELPSTELINDRRITRFKERITDTLATEELGMFYQLIEQYQHEHNVPALEIAAALAQLLQGDSPFLLQKDVQRENRARPQRRDKGEAEGKRRPASRTDFREKSLEEGKIRYRIEVGHNHKVKPGNIVGAIANEAGLESQYIGHIDIRDDHSLVDLPAGMPREVFNTLKNVRIAGQRMNISVSDGSEPESDAGQKRSTRPAGKNKHKPHKDRSSDRAKSNPKDKTNPKVKAKPGAAAKARTDTTRKPKRVNRQPD